MIDLIKELWYKRQVRHYRDSIAKITGKRRALKILQEHCNKQVELYTSKYDNISKLEK